MAKLSKEDLISAVAESTGQTKKLCYEVVDALFATMAHRLVLGDEVPVHRFGAFRVTERVVFEGQPGDKNRKKGTRKVLRFKASRSVKESLNS